MIENDKIVLKYFETVSSRESFYGLYYLGEMYRQGFLVDKNPDKAWDYYRDIVEDSNLLCESDDYYWRACYRMGMELYYIAGSLGSLKKAYRLVTKAKELYENRDSKAGPADITKEELYLNWEKLGREVQAYIKIIEEMPVVKKVRCIADDVLCLTKGKIYDVLVEKRDYYELVDDEEEDVYIYGKDLFEEIEP